MIKHLSPKTRNEIQDAILNSPASLEKIKLLNDNFIEVTEEEANEIFNSLKPNEKIRIGIRKNSPEIIKKAIKDANIPFHESHEVITWAIKNKHMDISDPLIKQLSPNQKITIGTETNNTELIKSQIENKTLSLSDWEFRDVIEWAINHNHKDIVRTLFLNDVTTKAKNVQSIKSEYLKTVISYGDAELVEILLKAGADIHVDMDLPLIQACNLENMEIAKMLMDNGADVNAQSGMALRSACMVGTMKTVEQLIKLGADIHSENDEPLRLAAANGHTEIVKLLLKKGADASAHNYLALYWSTLNGHTEIIKILEDEQKRLNKA